MWIAAWLVGCGTKSEPVDPVVDDVPDEVVPFAPAPATIVRLTDVEWRNSAEDLFGVRYEGRLPLDFRLLNYARVGGSQVTIPPADLDLYEAAAWDVARTAVPDASVVEGSIGADPSDLVAVRARLVPLLTRAWRRPPTTTELDGLVDRWSGVRTLTSDDGVAMQATIAAVLLSPDFLFRIEVGEPDPDHEGWRRLGEYELAARLASFLTASVPDQALIDAAASGSLDGDPDAVGAQAERLLNTPRARRSLAAFFGETVQLEELDAVTKDGELYPEFTAALRAEMRAEVEDLFTDVAFDRDADLRELLTTTRTEAGPLLSDLYGIGSSTEVPPERGGVLGRAAFLTIESHNTLTSPTNRGKFVRTRLLCQPIAPPPPGVNTDLGAVEGDTLREKLEQHAVDAACAPCHTLMDPIGFGLEHFDPIGRWRDTDAGFPIDATGEIAGVPFDGAAGLGQVVSEHEDFSRCLATELYRYANAAVERDEDDVVIDAIDADFSDAGRRLRPLVLAIVESEGFRTVAAPEAEDCATEGQTRSCESACGAGTETCHDGSWKGCTAPAAATEVCDGRDQDCDGDADEDLERTCTGAFGAGTQVCQDGGWSDCAEPAAPIEVCNGVDDDRDGATDEELAARLEPFTATELATEGHYACDVNADAWSPACHAAVHRGCAARGCAVTGFGPVAVDGPEWSVTCLDDTRADVVGTSFTELSGFHYGCNAGYRQGGACNAAISRLCSSRGLGTGYGPVENAGDAATVVCVPGATVLESSYSALSGLGGGCDGGSRWGAACDRAIHEWCVGQGYGSGFGPLENSGDLAIVACVGVP